MHAFNLVMTSFVGHSWALAIIKRSQRLVTFMRASHRPWGLVLQQAAALGIKKVLSSANSTRFTSTLTRLESILALEPALRLVVSKGDHGIAADVVDILTDPAYWREVELLCALLRPVAQVVMGIQSDQSTLADCTRYVLRYQCRGCILASPLWSAVLYALRITSTFPLHCGIPRDPEHDALCLEWHACVSSQVLAVPGEEA